MPGQRRAKKKIIIGLIGGISCGKTTVARMFSSLGAKFIDADRIAHKVILPASPVYKRLVAVFGPAVINKDKTLNRKKLGEIVFRKKSLLNKLNSIVHPQVIRTMKQEVKKIKNGIVILDAPLLVEAGLKEMADILIAVKANPASQLKRAKKKGLSKGELLRRIKYQIPLRKKLRFADFLIDNSGSLKVTKEQVKKIMSKLSLAACK